MHFKKPKHVCIVVLIGFLICLTSRLTILVTLFVKCGDLTPNPRPLLKNRALLL